MTRNVTLRMEGRLLQRCRRVAVEENKSLSRWIVDTLAGNVEADDIAQKSKKRAFARMRRGFSLGGTPASRREMYEF